MHYSSTLVPLTPLYSGCGSKCLEKYPSRYERNLAEGGKNARLIAKSSQPRVRLVLGVGGEEEDIITIVQVDR